VREQDLDLAVNILCSIDSDSKRNSITSVFIKVKLKLNNKKEQYIIKIKNKKYKG
jgi:hypothetical protein